MMSSLDAFFHPHGVAVIGASRDPTKLSHGVLRNLIEHGYPGPIYPVNPAGGTILGLTAYRSIAEVPDPVELAVIVLPADRTATALEECGQRGIRAAIVEASGFGEVGDIGQVRQRELGAIVRRYGMRLIGPNCVGVIDTSTPIDTTFITQMPDRGDIAFVSHSGAVCGGAIDWARSVGVGFSCIVSLGNQADVDVTDTLMALDEDPNTRVIVAYIEGIPDGRRFVEVAARVTRRKPIVVLKAGRTRAGTHAVASHTGALAGADRAYRAACQRAGVLSVSSVEELTDAAVALAYQPLPVGPRMAVLTNAGGPAALAADALEEQGLVLADLSANTQERLAAICPPGTMTSNPVDMLGGPRPEQYTAAIRVLLEAPEVDGIAAIFVPQAVTPVVEVAEAMGEGWGGVDKPVVGCITGASSIGEAVRTLNRRRVPHYPTPSRAATALGAMWRYAQLRDRPPLEPEPVEGADVARAYELLQQAWQDGQRVLDAYQSGLVAAAYGVPVPAAGLAATAGEAVALAKQVGYPVALKLVAPGVTHKADVGGVVLELADEVAVRAAFERVVKSGERALVQAMVRQGDEVIVGAQRDPQFGPLLMFGLGGIYVEVLEDVAFRLAPVSAAEARMMVEETGAGRLLAGVRGQPAADIAAVVDCLRRVGQLVTDFPCIAELDINPLIVGAAGQGAWAVDVRIVLDAKPEMNTSVPLRGAWALPRSFMKEVQGRQPPDTLVTE